MSKYLKLAAGVALSAFLLWWLFHETDWAAVWKGLRQANWLLIGAAFLSIVATFFTRTERWAHIVQTTQKVPFSQLFHATQIGFLANFILPLRAGEAIRALVLSLKTEVPFTRCLAFVALDRITDVLTLMIVLVVAMSEFRPTEPIHLPAEISAEPISPGLIQSGAVMTGIAAAGLVGTLALLYFQQRLVLQAVFSIVSLVSRKLAVRTDAWLFHFAQGLHILKRPTAMLWALAWSLPTWAGGMFAIALLLWAFNIDFPWYAPVLVQAFLAVAISAPGAPGFIGQFHFGVAAGLYATVPSISQADVSALAILFHLVNLLAVVVVGGYSLQVEGVGLLALRRRSEAAAEHLEEELEEEVAHELAEPTPARD